MMSRRIALIGEAGGSLESLRSALRLQGFETVMLAGGAGIADALCRVSPDAAIVFHAADPGGRAPDVVRQVHGVHPHVPCIVVAALSSEALAIGALRAGARDYFRDPWIPDDVVSAVSRCLRTPANSEREVGLTSEPPSITELHRLVGASEAIREIRSAIPRLAASDCNVLITGETGTGKDLVAELIHAAGPRRSRPFATINCAAIPDTLLESELFGHERGAFTGAHTSRPGQLVLAQGGSVLLDEIGDMNPASQAKILRVIEDKRVCPLGGRRAVPVDIRFLSATNRDLERLVREERFRADLYFRLNVVHLRLPSLRHRREDIMPLADCFLAILNGRLHRHVEGFTPDAIECLMRHDWPGNVRELKSCLEAIFIGQPSRRVAPGDLPALYRFRSAWTENHHLTERERLLSALSATNWNKSKAALSLHWSRMTLYRKMKRYEVHGRNEQVAGSRTETTDVSLGDKTVTVVCDRSTPSPADSDGSGARH